MELIHMDTLCKHSYAVYMLVMNASREHIRCYVSKRGKYQEEVDMEG